MLLLHAPRLGAHLQERQTGRVINEYWRILQAVARTHDAPPFLARQHVFAEFLPIHAALRAQDALYQLLLTHFQTEERHPIGSGCHVLRHIESKRSLTHRWARRQDDHLAALQTAEHLIKFIKTGRYTRHMLAFILLKRPDGFVQQFAQRGSGTRFTALRDRKDA